MFKKKKTNIHDKQNFIYHSTVLQHPIACLYRITQSMNSLNV